MQSRKSWGLTRAAISGYENNIKNPKPQTIAQLARIYGVSADYLLGVEHRKAVFIDDLPESYQKIAVEMLDIIRNNASTTEK